MASKSTLQNFQNQWNQTAAWAQSKGVKYNDYLPIYQQDSNRMLRYGTPMSQAERERAVLAAGNISGPQQQTPSTAPNAGNVIGNVKTDLHNIFTGLGDIVIHPLHNGLVDSIKNTVDMMMPGSHRFQGMNETQKIGNVLTTTVASWVPGMADIGTILNADPQNPMGGSKGAEALAEHPVSSILDVLPLAKPLTLAKTAGAAGVAARVGMSVEKAQGATVGRVMKGYLMNTQTSKIGPEGVMTIGDRFHALTGKSLGSNPDIADAALGVQTVPNHYTAEERAIFTPVEEATKNFTPEMTEQLHELMSPGHETNLAERMNDPELDPRIKNAAEALINGPRRFMVEEDVAAKDGPTGVTDPRTGKVGLYSSTDHTSVIGARDRLVTATKDVLETLPEFEKLHAQSVQADQLFTTATDDLAKANQKAREVKVDGNYTQRSFGDHRDTPFAKSGIVHKMYGDGGFIDQLLNHAKEGKYEDVSFLASAALKRMEKWGTREVEAASDPAFLAVKAQVEKLQKTAKIVLALRKKADVAVHGKARLWKGTRGHRDAQHKTQADVLKKTHQAQLKELGNKRTVERARLDNVWRMKKTEITERIATQRASAVTANGLAREKFKQWAIVRSAEDRAAGQVPRPLVLIPGQPGTAEFLKAADDRIVAQGKAELADAEKAQNQMIDKLNRAFGQDKKDLQDAHAQSLDKATKEHVGQKARDGKVSEAYREWTDAQAAFSKEVWNHPPDAYTDLYFNLFAKHLLENEHSAETLSRTEKALADKYGWGDEHIQNLRKNPAVMAQLVQLGIRGAFDHPVFKAEDESLVAEAQASALNELHRLRAEGIEPEYIPHVSTAQLRADETGSYGIRLLVGKGIPKPDAFSARTWGMESSRYDIMAGIHRGVKQVLDRDATVEFVDKYLSPRVSTAGDLQKTIFEYYPEIAKLSGQSVTDFMNAKLKDWNLVKFDPQSIFGFTMPRWGEGEVYLDKNLVNAVGKLTANKELPTGLGGLDKATRLFRFSILGLSPRYTAHILFGGSFLLALRSTPFMPFMLGDAYKALKTGQIPENLLTAPTNLGTTDYALRSFGNAAGKQTAHLLAQEHIEKVQKVSHVAAKPIHWLKALGDLNLRFTHHVVNMQRAAAYLDGAAKAGRHGVTDEFGHPVEMTKERMMNEGMDHAARVMGDLRKMSPLERTVARSIVPFYGWEKHILQYVLSFPADHPWRALMLAQMGEYDTAHEPAGLPSRYQFLFFLGHPDDQGNVTALDLRAMNPLRDVANYATLGGFIASINPVLTSAVGMVDPSITFGGTPLYPNLSYDQFYGIETAGPQGSPLTAAEAVIPQISGIQGAMQLAGQRQGLSGAALTHHIFDSLGLLMETPQQINLKQEAAKTAIARYQVTKNLASNAWKTGDFSGIADLGSVPDPRNPAYETPVSDLQKLYDQLAKSYPGAPPADVAQPLPAVHL